MMKPSQETLKVRKRQPGLVQSSQVVGVRQVEALDLWGSRRRGGQQARQGGLAGLARAENADDGELLEKALDCLDVPLSVE